eukprot:CAMPEP_0181446912 /NCGR_PEP_ID=MMETSP1110-20121109/26352_1 /TAXON_ID=174948 /ORGANISM="Symbiodinium sp., Strain CCMP421" /LENGTH=42 /DNA_ID= /DNA_START= /DNA_END= /DNA_ORIENTATION=
MTPDALKNASPLLEAEEAFEGRVLVSVRRHFVMERCWDDTIV